MFEYNDGFEQKIWNSTRTLSVALCAFVICLVITAGSAWSSEQAPLKQQVSYAPSQNTGCNAYLVQRVSAPPMPASMIGPPDLAASAAAISLAFGVRYAVGPREHTGYTDDIDTFAERAAKAQAIVAYRRCKNEQALNDLNTAAGG